MHKVSIIVQVRRPGITPRRLRAVLVHVLRRERCPRRTAVNVVLVGDAAIRRLNRRYCGADRPTDVLAFPSDMEEQGTRLLGDVVVSVDRARVQAREIGHPVRTEVALLATHGVLHLLGYDDTTRSAARRMMRRQQVRVAEAGEEVRG